MPPLYVYQHHFGEYFLNLLSNNYIINEMPENNVPQREWGFLLKTIHLNEESLNTGKPNGPTHYRDPKNWQSKTLISSSSEGT